MKISVVILTLSLLCIVLVHSSAGFTSGAGRNMDPPGRFQVRRKGDVKMLSEIIGKIMERALDLPRKDEDKVKDKDEDKDVFDEMVM